MLYQIQAYFAFLLKSTNQHGVHSPFVYNLVTQCFYDKKHYKAYKALKAYRNTLHKSDVHLSVTDFGAGSKTFTSKNRAVSALAKRAGITAKNAKLLYRLSQYFKPNTVLELGTCLGLGTQALSLGHLNAKVTTIEGCSELSKYSLKMFKQHNLSAINTINNEFSKAIGALEEQTFDLVFFDGNHQKNATITYFETLLPKAHNDSVFIFDDIYWSKGMTEAWDYIKKHPKVSVTVDTYQWGIVFFRKEQAKEHFCIRS